MYNEQLQPQQMQCTMNIYNHIKYSVQWTAKTISNTVYNEQLQPNLSTEKNKKNRTLKKKVNQLK